MHNLAAFDPRDHFEPNIISCTMLASFVLSMPTLAEHGPYCDCGLSTAKSSDVVFTLAPRYRARLSRATSQRRYLVLLSQRLPERVSELVWTGGFSRPARYAFQPIDHVMGIHACDKFGYSRGVAGAPVRELDIGNSVSV